MKKYRWNKQKFWDNCQAYIGMAAFLTAFVISGIQ